MNQNQSRLLRGKFRPITAFAIACVFTISACSNSEAAPTTAPKISVTLMAPQAAPTLPAQPTAVTSVVATALPNPTTASAATLPANANPFTGLPVDESIRKNRPVLIKIANTPEIRPQTGLQAADIVVEHYVEGGVTRFTALYFGNPAQKVGSVRSCRLIDKELPIIFDTALMCSGMVSDVKRIIRESPVFQNGYTLISDFGECENPGVPPPNGCPLFRDPPDFSYAPHNLWGNVPNALSTLSERGKNDPTQFKSWVFSPAVPAGGVDVVSVGFEYRYGVVGWQYDATSSTWQRTLAGETWVEKSTGKPIAAANVIALETPHITTLIVEDKTGARSIEIQLWGEGPAKFFRDGKLVFGRWRRPATPAVLELFDSEGKPYALKPGNTWIQMVPPDLVIQAK